MPVQLDVTNGENVRAAFEETQSERGVVTILVNNAGADEESHLLDTAEQDWDHVIDVNLKGPWRVAREAAKRMVVAQSGGSIINIASVLAFTVSLRSTTYCVSKAGLSQMTKTMALDLWEYGIRVNATAPGYFHSEMTQKFLKSDAGREYLKNIPPGRAGRLDELTAPLLMLASDASSYVNGVVLPVDGGHSLRLT